MNKLFGLFITLGSVALFFLLSWLGQGVYLRYTLLTFGVGAGILVMVFNGLLSAFQNQDLGGLDKYLEDTEGHEDKPKDPVEEPTEEPKEQQEH